MGFWKEHDNSMTTVLHLWAFNPLISPIFLSLILPDRNFRQASTFPTNWHHVPGLPCALQVSLPVGNSLLSICFAPVQSVLPDGNSFEIYLFKSQLHISLLMFLVRFSSCPRLSRLATAPSLQAVLSPGLRISEHPNLQRHFCHRVAVAGALICTAANNDVCQAQRLCQSWTATGEKKDRNVLKKKLLRLQEVTVVWILMWSWGSCKEHGATAGKARADSKSANQIIQVGLKTALCLQE